MQTLDKVIFIPSGNPDLRLLIECYGCGALVLLVSVIGDRFLKTMATWPRDAASDRKWNAACPVPSPSRTDINYLPINLPGGWWRPRASAWDLRSRKHTTYPLRFAVLGASYLDMAF